VKVVFTNKYSAYRLRKTSNALGQ